MSNRTVPIGLKKTYAKSMLALLLSLSSAVTLTACGAAGTPDDGKADSVQLEEPVSVAVSSVKASRRTIYDAKALSAICTPKVYERTFSTDITFASYEKMPGETVGKGDVIIRGDTRELEKQVKEIEEAAEDAAYDYEDSLEPMQEELQKAKYDLDTKEKPVKELEPQQPSGDDPEYYKWIEEYYEKNELYQNAQLVYDQAELDIRQKTALYDIDAAYQKQRIADLNREAGEKQLTSGVSGTVVGLGFINAGERSRYYESGDWIGKNTIGAAIGSLSEKELRCEYVNPGVINKAEDVYAIVNGKRYEVTYQAISTEEYKRLSDKNGDVYSAFTIEDPNGEVPIGSYAVITIVNAAREDVLCVPTASVSTDANGTHVYVMEDGAYRDRIVKTGIKDPEFTEILSGISEGDEVKTDYKVTNGKKDAVLKKGSISYAFSAAGYLFYPSTKQLKNPVEHGTTYLDELLVHRYEHVTKGQVVAKVHVVPDPVETDRTKRKIQRLQEKIADLQSDGVEIQKDLKKAQDKKNKKEIEAAEDRVKNNDRAIARLQRQITDLQEDLTALEQDATVTQITASHDGIITEITDLEDGDLLPSGGSVAKLASENSCFIMIDDADGKLSYGNTVTVTYDDKDGQKQTAEGTVVTANPMTTSKAFHSGFAIAKLPADVIAQIAGNTPENNGWWSRARLDVKATIRSMDNVLLVPKAAVMMTGGSTYVTVRDTDGTLHEENFIAGGSDASNYWVVEGLSEGTTICWES